MASGYAYSDDKGKIGYYKDALPGGQLPLKGLPRGAKTVILHTRLTTHGTERNNDNNHPVISPNNKLALTHNGVIWNEQEIRNDVLIGVDLPEVDTSVIGALIQNFGIEGVGELSGDAAIAWLESGKGDELNIARLESSPLCYTWLLDGSFVYASTPRLLMDALDEMKLDYGAVFIMDERVYFKVVNGIIMEFEETPKLKSYTYNWDSYRTRQLTNGGSQSKSFRNIYDPNTQTWSFEEFPPKDEDEYDYDGDEQKAITAAEQAKVLVSGDTDDDTDEFDESDDVYYTVDQDGDFQTYATLDKLENELKWYAALHSGEDQYGATGMVRWIEHFIDVGAFELDGKTSVSWVDDPNEVYIHEDPDGESLSYIREGIGYLQRAIGA
jgi:hypothetical protein